MKVKNNEIIFAKIRESAVIPTKRDEDAGYDMYANFDEDFFVIEPYQTRPVPTGIAAAFSKKYYAQVEERGSTGKIGIKKSSGVIDSGYRGEYLILLYNTNSKPFIISKIKAEALPDVIKINDKKYKISDSIIYPYTKGICQIVLHEVPRLKTREISYEDLLKIESERGSGKFGQSGK